MKKETKDKIKGISVLIGIVLYIIMLILARFTNNTELTVGFLVAGTVFFWGPMVISASPSSGCVIDRIQHYNGYL